MSGNKELRSELSAITRENPLRHPEMVASLARKHMHSISVVRDEAGQVHRILANCFEFAFGLRQFDEYDNITLCDYQEGLHQFVANSKFVAYLLEKGILKECSTRPEGNLALYFNSGGKPTHAGLLVGEDRIRSKWGIGLLWDHELWEVPSSYGDNVRYYERPDPQAVFEAFLSWMPTQQGYDEFKKKYSSDD